MTVGAAYIVNHIQENKKYVAKKVILEGLGDRELQGCMMEANLLKNLNHPNIVGYKESFMAASNLTIIMEYCEGKYHRYYAFSLTNACHLSSG